ncbi:MAG: class I SAM-dependent methyltransferase family protein [Candidatus Thermoplasmatota archaeon]|nr:class I SAM-dependent methyltransferase family protein [Candidatus Thermoplasmatota archaeon]
MTIHVSVNREDAQDSISILKRMGIIDNSHKIYNSGERVFIPVKSADTIPESVPGTIIDLDGKPNEEKLRPLIQPGSFDVIGHIAIIKNIDGKDYSSKAEEILKTRKSIRTVYLDMGVKGDHRKRTLELLAGEDLPETLYRENGITLRVNVRKAYFSPRLATERLLISSRIRNGEYVCDMFSGIGPFSISIAKNARVRVVAIDSNCDAVEILRENIKINRLAGTIDAICADSSAEISRHGKFDRIIMNLPHDAFNFIDNAYAALNDGGMINYYEISTDEGITDRMMQFRDMGLKLTWKRVVHGYSKMESLHSMEFQKIPRD